MDDSVPAQGGGPIYYQRDVILKELVVDSVSTGDTQYRVIFAGSSTLSLTQIEALRSDIHKNDLQMRAQY